MKNTSLAKRECWKLEAMVGIFISKSMNNIHILMFDKFNLKETSQFHMMKILFLRHINTSSLKLIWNFNHPSIRFEITRSSCGKESWIFYFMRWPNSILLFDQCWFGKVLFCLVKFFDCFGGRIRQWLANLFWPRFCPISGLLTIGQLYPLIENLKGFFDWGLIVMLTIFYLLWLLTWKLRS